MPNVNPEILRWARETAGLSLEEAAKKLDLAAARGVAADARLAALEAGETEPSRPLLVRMSKQYRRPLLAFYLPAPPREGEKGRDFRTLPDSVNRREEALVEALLRDVRTRQSMVRALLEAEEEAVQHPFVGRATVKDGVARVAGDISQTLGLDLGQFRCGVRGMRNAPKGFAYLRERAEAAGVFVLLIGNLGNHVSAIDVDVFRGFALADPIAPFIVINDQDSEKAWSFTLVHELTHVWLGQTGVSGGAANSRIERFCNDVASLVLVPAEDLHAAHSGLPEAFEDLLQHIDAVAERLNVSCSMVAYRLLREGLIEHDTWNQVRSFFRSRWLAARSASRNAVRDGRPSYYTVRRHRLGSRLLALTRRMVTEGALSPSKAARILGVKPVNVYHLLADASAADRVA